MAKKTTKKAVTKKVASRTSATKKTAKKAAPKKAVKKAPAKKASKKASAKKAVKKAPAKKASKKAAPKKATKKAASKKQTPAAAPKVTTVNPGLVFNGNCEEAFSFYRSVFGGNFSYMGRYSEMPAEGGQPVPEGLAHKIMHVSLPISKETVLIGNDAMDGYGPPTIYGNNFCLSINAPTKEEADRLYNELSSGGQPTMPMSKTFWGSYFGVLFDRFGISWMISFS